MGPLNADLFCKEVSNSLNIDVAVVDVNDLGGVKVLASSNKKENKILKRNLLSNPAGNGDEKTPILLINRIGVTRITFALFVGFLFKLVGIKGMFYRLTGSESSLIDDISGTVTPYDKSIVMGPLNADLFCREVSNYLNLDVALVDVNDLGGVKVLASSNKKVNKILKRNLKSNPAGNGDEKTPIVLIREKSK